MKFPSYPKYKESGVEWLGHVPEHWEVKRGRFCMQVNPRTDKLRLLGPDDEVSFVPMDAVGEYGGLRLDTTKPLADIGTGYTEFQNGDVVVAKITPCFENWKGALASSLFNGVAMGTTELHVLRTLQCLDAQFLFYLTLSNGYRKTGEAEMYGAGGQKRVPPEFNKDFRTPLPPLPEQHAIAAFLDAQTAKLDTLIAKKRALIDKLKEKRAALITRTVTRGLPPEAAKAAGLDPNPRMKDSGVEWLGEVPEHWEVKRLKYIAESVQIGPFGGMLTEVIDYPTDIKLYGQENVISGDFGLGFRWIPDEFSWLLHKYSVDYGDILVTRKGSLGYAQFIPRDYHAGIIDSDTIRIRAKKLLLDFRFLRMVISESRYISVQIEMNRRGAILSGVNTSVISGLMVMFPPMHEQLAILDYIHLEASKIDTLVNKIESAIAKLQEYRSALITAAVTGKIDVRGVSI